MKSKVIKRSIRISGRSTGISVEDDFWNALRQIAKKRHESLSGLVSSINAERKHANLSSAIRMFVLSFYRDQ
jgi:predicted DNA-binding ribbon-helix-helix protein